MVLRIGIFLNISLINETILFPKKDKEIPPTIIIIITDNKISKPGIEKGK